MKRKIWDFKCVCVFYWRSIFWCSFGWTKGLLTLQQVVMQWEKLKPPEPDDPLCCCECDVCQCTCCCDCEDLDEAFSRYERKAWWTGSGPCNSLLEVFFCINALKILYLCWGFKWLSHSYWADLLLENEIGVALQAKRNISQSDRNQNSWISASCGELDKRTPLLSVTEIRHYSWQLPGQKYWLTSPWQKKSNTWPFVASHCHFYCCCF